MTVQEKSPLLKPEPSKARGKEPDVDIRAEFLSLTSMALQVSLSTFARLALTSVDYAFLGHLGTKELAAASLSSVWTSVPLMGVWAGAGALTTLCGQAWGAKNYELTGVWLQMGTVVCSIFVIPVFIWYWCVEYALALSTDDPEVIHLGGRFARIISFASWPAVVYACVRLYFQSMGIMAPTTVVGALSIGVAVMANYFLIYGCFGWGGLGFDGSPLATVIASWFQPIALVSYCVLYKKMHLRAWGGWDLTAFTPDRLKTYANIAGFIAANSMISNLASSSLSLIAAKLGSDIIAANAVITGLWRLLWALFWGFGCATQIRVANCLGANRPRAAKALAKLGFGCTIACVAVLATITLSLREKLFQLYTTDDDLLRLCMLVQPIFITGYMIESIEMLTSGVLTAMGRVRIIAWTSTFSTWCIELPMAYIGGIVLGFGFPALWYSICTMEVVKLIVYLITLSRTDWNEMARTAVENMEVTDETTGELEDEAFSFALSEGGNAPLGYNTVPLSPLTPIPTPSSISSKQWGDDVEDGNGLHIRRSRRTGSTSGL
uniref:Multidrug and toxin extrusion protein n=1 Tax=Globisporangium ultimum (strain ATCC 200006 / CBS 805.95 / DAOM BR144) TaxID=431595 RepID=K3X0N7_GLOUD